LGCVAKRGVTAIEELDMLDALVDFVMHVVGFKTGAISIRLISLGRVSHATIGRFPYATAALGLIEIFVIVVFVVRCL
jgi:hypothetical protein